MNSGRRIYRVLVVLTALAMLAGCVPVPITPIPPTPGSPGVADLIAQLADQDAGVRLRAAYQLGELWPTDENAVKALIQAAGDPDSQVRTVATYALGKTRPATRPTTDQVVSTLFSRLKDDSPQVRYSAVRALGRIGPAAQAAVPVLEGALRDKDENLRYAADENLRYAAVEALAQLGVSEDTIPVLIDALADPSWYVANRASDLLVTYGEAGADGLVKDLRANTEWGRRNAILRTLARMPEFAAPRLGAILAEGSDTADSLKTLSAAGLGQMGPLGQNKIAAKAQGGSLIATDALVQYAGQAIPVLTTIAANPSNSISLRKQAIQSLGAIGTPSVESLIDLLDKLSPNDAAYEAVVTGLSTIAADPTHVIPKLLTILQNTQTATRTQIAAVNALSAYGTEAGEGIRVLQTLLQAQDQDADLRVAAAGALGKIGPGRPEVIASLSAALTQCDDVASSAAQALGRMGLMAQDPVPALVTALRCPNPQVQAAAADALGEIRPISVTVTSALVEQLGSTTDMVLSSTATALGRIGPGALPALVAALTTAESPTTRRWAAVALSNMGAAAAPTMVQLLEREDMIAQTRNLASRVLTKIGVPALPFLIQGLRQGEVPARKRILETLYGIGPHAFEGFQWALQDSALAVDTTTLAQIYGEFQTNDDVTNVTEGFAVPEALPYLITALLPVTTTINPVTTTVELRRQAARAIGFVGPDAAPAAPVLALALADSDTTLQCEAALALLLIGPGAGAAAPALTAALTNAREDTVCVLERENNEGESAANQDRDVFRMLEARRPTGYELLQAELLSSKNKISLQRLLINVLAGLGPRAEVAIPDLIRSLRTPTLRRPAAEALARIGSAARPALLELLRPPSQVLSTPGLAEALAGFDSNLRRSAAYALRQNAGMLDPITVKAIGSLIQNAGEDRFVRAMLASSVAAQAHPLPEFWAEIGLADPASTICPRWPAMASAMATNPGVELTGLDLYTDTCVYRRPATAPTWDEVYQWLMSYW